MLKKLQKKKDEHTNTHMNTKRTEDQSAWHEFIPGSAWCASNLLTPEECQKLVQIAKDEGIEAMDYSGDTRHRQRVTVRLGSTNAVVSQIRKRIWERIKTQIPQEIVIDEDVARNHEGFRHIGPSDCIIGKWTACGLDENYFNVALCTGKGHLAAHRDADIVVSEHERSFITINGFLTGRPLGSGGATRFMRDDIKVKGAEIVVDEESDVLYRAESDEAGKAVVFLHGLVHDGEPLVEHSPEKWIFRSVVQYKRDPASAPNRTPEQVQALEFLKEAERAEQEGSIPEAIRLYKKAYKLDPTLESQ